MRTRRLALVAIFLTVACGAEAQSHQFPAVDTNNIFTRNEPHPGTETKSLYISGPIPWFDVRTFGARPLPATDRDQITTATCKGTSIRVEGAKDFIAGDGIVVSRCGKRTSQRTPAAPTVTSLGPTGSSTISYECVAADSLEGLTRAGPPGSTTTAPTVFGNLPVGISSISRSGNVVTVNFTSPINAKASLNQHIVVWNVEGAATSFNGLFLIASSPSPTRITYNQIGPNESGTVSRIVPYSVGKLINAFRITSITRTGNVVTITTDVPHNIPVGTAAWPTLVEIYGVYPTDLDGWYPVGGVAASTITLYTGLYVDGIETGVPYVGNGAANGQPEWNTMGVVAWESNLVNCGTPRGSTSFYYLYANYIGSGPYDIIGSTTPGVGTYQDWGPFLNKKTAYPYTAPPAADVPRTAPSTDQNQEYVGTVTGILGTDFTVSPPATTGDRSERVFHDNSVAVGNAINSGCNVANGSVYLSGPNWTNLNSNQYQYYIFNAPFAIPSAGQNCSQGVTILVGDNLWTNDTVNKNAPLNLKGQGTSQWLGNANPLLNDTDQSSYGLYITGLGFYTQHDGQFGVVSNARYANYTGVSFDSPGNTAIGFWSNSTDRSSFTNYFCGDYWGGFPGYDGLYQGSSNAVWNPDGFSIVGAPIPNMLWSDATQMVMECSNNSQGKGIEIYSSQFGGLSNTFKISNIITDQAPLTPVAWTYGNVGMTGIDIHDAIPDSVSMSVFSQIGAGTETLTISNVTGAGINAITGAPLRGIFSTQDNLETSTPLGQNVNSVREDVYGTIYAGPYGTTNATNTDVFQQKPLIFPEEINFPMAWNFYVPNVRATATGSGSWPAGTHYACVLPVGWNGGDAGDATMPNNGCGIAVTTSKSQAIQISWSSTAGAMGYDIYIDGRQQNRSMIPVGTTTENYRGNGLGASQPSRPGSGFPLLDKNGLTTPIVRTEYTMTIGPQTISGCSLSSPLGGSSAGSFISGTSGMCMFTVTPGLTALKGWACDAHDLTTPAHAINQTEYTTTTASFKGTAASGDVIIWKCAAF